MNVFISSLLSNLKKSLNKLLNYLLIGMGVVTATSAVRETYGLVMKTVIGKPKK